MSIRGWLLALTLACLAGCGGRDARTAATSDPQAVSKPDPPPATTPAPGTSSSGWCTDPRPALGSSAGGIEGTGFGPVRRKLANIAVAGQMWDVSHAAVLINGQPATSAQIADGIITTVQGTLAATGAATAASVASESRSQARSPASTRPGTPWLCSVSPSRSRKTPRCHHPRLWQRVTRLR